MYTASPPLRPLGSAEACSKISARLKTAPATATARQGGTRYSDSPLAACPFARACPRHIVVGSRGTGRPINRGRCLLPAHRPPRSENQRGISLVGLANPRLVDRALAYRYFGELNF